MIKLFLVKVGVFWSHTFYILRVFLCFNPDFFCMQQCQVSSRRQLWFKQSYNFSWVTSFDSCECFFLIIEVDWCSHVICYDLVFGTDASGTNERLVEPVASHRVSEVLCEVSVRFQRMQRAKQTTLSDKRMSRTVT